MLVFHVVETMNDARVITCSRLDGRTIMLSYLSRWEQKTDFVVIEAVSLSWRHANFFRLVLLSMIIVHVRIVIIIFFSLSLNLPPRRDPSQQAKTARRHCYGTHGLVGSSQTLTFAHSIRFHRLLRTVRDVVD